MKTKYGSYKCKVCNKQCRAWVESQAYKEELCAKHLQERHNYPI